MVSPSRSVLWADDEVDLLRAHLLFLGERGYQVTPVTNGDDAIALVKGETFDIVLLDEMMPGRDGLSTLAAIKEINPNLPVIMLTKAEEEWLMDEAIAQRIDDYLTKPVNPSQILSACKRLLETREIRSSRLVRDYTETFNSISAALGESMSWREWIDIYVRLTLSELEIGPLRDPTLDELHAGQRREADALFGRFVEATYHRWVHGEDRPPLSMDVVPNYVVPPLREGRQVVLLVLDCMRLDVWLAIEPLLADDFDVRREYYYGILPTATPYARNAIFAGLFPGEIASHYPQYWGWNARSETSLNQFEKELLGLQLQRLRVPMADGPKYMKISDAYEASAVADRLPSLRSAPLVVLVYNFLDLLVHGRSESDLLQEIVPDQAAFRSLARSWFLHAPLFDMLKGLADAGVTVILTTDHGAVLGTRGTLVRGSRRTSTSLRYKYGDSLRCDPRGAIYVRHPEAYGLPRFSPATNYVIAKEDYYFVYPTRYREYERQYRNSFQHGGASLEEMILPIATLTAKRHQRGR
jgi:DNA-binding response OmpR family regulator